MNEIHFFAIFIKWTTVNITSNLKLFDFNVSNEHIIYDTRIHPIYILRVSNQLK